MLTADEREELEDLIELACGNTRSGWEEQFVQDMRDKSNNPFWRPTERQWEKLQEIAERDDD